VLPDGVREIAPVLDPLAPIALHVADHERHDGVSGEDRAQAFEHLAEEGGVALAP
jgi:hypothetical protein